jgi:hypothetical protein
MVTPIDRRESEGKLEETQRIAHVDHWDHDAISFVTSVLHAASVPVCVLRVVVPAVTRIQIA